MDISDELVATSRGLIKARIVTLASTIFASVYLISRSIAAVGENGITLSNTAQFVRDGLSFAYGPMSIAWPLIVGGTCVIDAALRARLSAALLLLSEHTSLHPATVAIFNPFRSHAPSEVAFSRLVHWLPIAAILAHAAGVGWELARLPLDMVAPWLGEWRAVVGWMAFAATGLGLHWVDTTPFVMHVDTPR